MIIRVVEEEEVCPIVLICQVLIQTRVDDGGERIGVTLVGYMAENVRLGKKEEEALHCDGHNNNDGGYRGGGEGEVAVSLLLNLEAARGGRIMLFSDD
jgi:hypothetical protein